MKKFFLFTTALLAAAALRAGVVLADGGRTDYSIEVRAGAAPSEVAAARDLAKYLSQITGAKFTVGGGGAKRLRIGTKAPDDQTPLRPLERRVRSYDGDLYFYGDGPNGAAFAVYDFLEKFLDCRWYTLRGRERIPRNPRPEFDKVEFSHVPSFPDPYIFAGTWFLEPKLADDFARRSRIYITKRGIVQIGPDYSHIPGRIVPPGARYKKHVGLWKPYKGCESEEWFTTHPEYFSQNPQGKRVPDVQLCYSNPALRKLMDDKMDKIIREEYSSGVAYLRCDLNDNPGFNGKTICCCPGCMKLVKKYGSPAGPYWDYVLELCARLEKSHPGIRIVNTAYLTTEKYPEVVAKMPDNLVMRYCPLNKNYLKPYDHPSNRQAYQRLAEWCKHSRNVWVQLYPTIYPRSTSILPLCANLRQLAQNIRVCRDLGVANIDLEQGYTWTNVNGFNEMREYMLGRLLNDASLDENAVIEEFIRDNYGAAAKLMTDYWRELETLEAKEKVGLTWTGLNFGSFGCLTRENLVRWSRRFDEMEKLTDDDKAAHRAVREARANLDEALLSVIDRLPKTPEFSPVRIAKRAESGIVPAIDELAAWRSGRSREVARNLTVDQRLANGVEFFLALSRTPRPLPAGLKRQYRGKCRRMLPTRLLSSQTSHIRHVVPDGKAAFGVAMKCNRAKIPEKFNFPTIVTFRPSGERFYVKLNDIQFVEMKALEAHRGEYRLYHVGTTRLYPQCRLSLHNVDAGGATILGQFFDPKEPEKGFDVYVSLKLDDAGALWLGEVVLMETGAPCRGQTVIPAAAAG